MKLAVVGSRTGIDKDFVNNALAEFVERVSRIDCLISGGAEGVDSFASDWALGIVKVKTFKPDWKHYGKPAGAIRNQKIVDECDQIMIFWNGQSRGTKITLDMAVKSRKPITLFVCPGDLDKRGLPSEEKAVKAFQKNLRARRLGSGISQAELGRQTGVDIGYLSKLEIGNRENPSLKIIFRLSKYFDCPVSELLGE